MRVAFIGTNTKAAPTTKKKEGYIMKAKRMAAVLLAAALTLPCWNLAAKAAFSDVPSNAWYA